MNKLDTLNNLFVFEMANNHQGSVEHGLAIIEHVGRIAQEESVTAAVEFQFRDLDPFIHPDYQLDPTETGKPVAKHTPRFRSTRLSSDDFGQLIVATKEAGMFAMVTPFDEVSVGRAIDLGADILKVQSRP